MTAITQPRRHRDETLRVVEGQRKGRPSIAPWMVVAALGVSAFFGQGIARTALDRSAMDLAQLNREIAVQEAINLELTLKIARMESPARIAPLAELLGLVLPQTTHQLLADLDGPPPAVAGSVKIGTDQ